MSFYDTLSEDRKAQCRVASFGDSALFGHVVTTGAVLFEYPTDRLSAANVAAIIAEVEKLSEDQKETINSMLRWRGAKTRI